ncbi:hypothetical protein ACQZV8_03730 [Magnetococcales bacterium HHB-1]
MTTQSFDPLQDKSHDLLFKTKQRFHKGKAVEVTMKSQNNPSAQEIAKFLRIVADQIDAGKFDQIQKPGETPAHFVGAVKLKESSHKRENRTHIRFDLDWSTKIPSQKKIRKMARKQAREVIIERGRETSSVTHVDQALKNLFGDAAYQRQLDEGHLPALGGGVIRPGMFSHFGISGVEESLTSGLASLDGDALKVIQHFDVSVVDNKNQPRPIIAVLDDLKDAGAQENAMLSFLFWLIDYPVKIDLNLSDVSISLLKQGMRTLFT